MGGSGCAAGQKRRGSEGDVEIGDGAERESLEGFDGLIDGRGDDEKDDVADDDSEHGTVEDGAGTYKGELRQRAGVEAEVGGGGSGGGKNGGQPVGECPGPERTGGEEEHGEQKEERDDEEDSRMADNITHPRAET